MGMNFYIRVKLAIRDFHEGMEQTLKELNIGLHVNFLIYVVYIRKDCDRKRISM
jgi:hypothetical protein